MVKSSGGAVYGTLMIGALLSAESARRETYPETVSAVVIATALLWLAHSYAEFTERRLSAGETFSFAHLGRNMAHEVTVVIGASGPLLAVLIWWLAGAALTSAVSAAIWTSAVILFVIEVAAGVRAELRGRELLLQVVLGAVLGGLVLTLKLVFVH